MPIVDPPYKREPREPTGYAAVYERRSYRPPQPIVTYWLLGIIVAVFVLELLVLAFAGSTKENREAWFTFLFLIGPDWIARPWSPITSTLSHGDFSHLFFNGLFLYFFGPTVERIVSAKRYVALFLVTGALSGIVQVYLSSYMGGGGYALGASGALMALFGVMLVLMPKSQMFVFPLPIPIPLWVGGIFYVLADVAGVFNPYDRVGNFAHLSGLALGALYGWKIKQDLARRGLRIAHG